jgi:hypothetical protein
VIDKSAIIGSKLGFESASGIDSHGLALLIKKKIFAAFYIEAM